MRPDSVQGNRHACMLFGRFLYAHTLQNHKNKMNDERD